MKPSLEELAVRYGILVRRDTLILNASAEWDSLTPEDLPRVLLEPFNGSPTDWAYSNYCKNNQELLKAVAERWLQEHAGE